MNAISLFSGIGGMDIGFSAAGFNIIAQVEIDEYCRRVLKRHAPEWWEDAIQFTDVCQFGRDSIKGNVAVIFGGFPCQPHSVAGKRKGAMDSRNLWPEFRRIISEFRPGAVLLENVPGILSTGYAPIVIAGLASLGYVGRSGIISAQDAGAPHRRERWWCVAYPSSLRYNSTTLTGKDEGSFYQTSTRSRIPAGVKRVCTRRVASRQSMGNGNGKRCKEPHFPSVTITKELYHRSAGKREGCGQTQPRLRRANHGLPDWLDAPQWPATQGAEQYPYEAPRTVQEKTEHDTNRIKALGNAVVPQIVYALAQEIKTHLQEVAIG